MGEIGGECSTHGKRVKCVQIMVRKREGKRSLERSMHRWDNYTTIRTDIREIWWKCTECIHVTGCGPVTGCCGHVNELSVSINGRKLLNYPTNYQLKVNKSIKTLLVIPQRNTQVRK